MPPLSFSFSKRSFSSDISDILANEGEVDFVTEELSKRLFVLADSIFWISLFGTAAITSVASIGSGVELSLTFLSSGKLFLFSRLLEAIVLSNLFSITGFWSLIPGCLISIFFFALATSEGLLIGFLSPDKTGG